MALLLTTSTGCFGPRAVGRGAHLFTGIIIGATAVAAMSDRERTCWSCEEPRHITYITVNSGPAAAPAPPPPPSTRDRVEPTKRPRNEAVAARTALSKVDVSACRAAGAPRGYGHANVTFDRAGHVSKVVVDRPAGLSPAAVACLGDKLGSARLDASEVDLTVGTTYFVR